MRTSRSLTFALATAGLALAPAAANAKTKVVYPVVTSVAPLHAKVGDKLVLKGKNFRVGKGTNTVVFKRDGQPGIFVKAQVSTRRLMTVVIPDKVGGQLAKDAAGAGRPTTFRLRVLAARFAKRYTTDDLSPVISPKPKLAPGGTGAGSGSAVTDAYQTCLAAVPGTPNADADADGLTNAVETAVGLDPCTADTDGDGVSDGYEYYSALDLNGTALPYPGKRPWPNPLDPNDVNSDFDGDGLYMWQEYKLWKFVSGTFPLVAYSDGTQNTGGSQPVTTLAQQYLDLDGDGNLTDDERDADNDGLSNVVEFNTSGTQRWWNKVDWHYKPHSTATSYVEPPYTLRLFNDVDPTNADTDGDGLPDGADDQDNDGWSNFVEMQLGRGRTGYRVHAFNPCLPDPYSPTCSRYIPLEGTPWPPYDPSDNNVTTQWYGDGYPFAWHNQLYSDWVTAGSHAPSPPAILGPWNPGGTLFAGAWDYRSGPQGP